MAMMGKAAGLPPCKGQRFGSRPAIYRLLKNHAFGPDEIKVLTTAYEEALRTLRLENRADPATEMIAKKIIEFAQRGERDPVRLREQAIRSLSN
jgi:hypothetical protein